MDLFLHLVRAFQVDVSLYTPSIFCWRFHDCVHVLDSILVKLSLGCAVVRTIAHKDHVVFWRLGANVL